MRPVHHIVIVGGGTAGWLAAAGLGKIYEGRLKVTLLESDLIPTVGVGEATIPTMQAFHKLLAIPEHAVLQPTSATYQAGINLPSWGQMGDDPPRGLGQVGRIVRGGARQPGSRRGCQ